MENRREQRLEEALRHIQECIYTRSDDLSHLIYGIARAALAEAPNSSETPNGSPVNWERPPYLDPPRPWPGLVATPRETSGEPTADCACDGVGVCREHGATAEDVARLDLDAEIEAAWPGAHEYLGDELTGEWPTPKQLFADGYRTGLASRGVEVGEPSDVWLEATTDRIERMNEGSWRASIRAALLEGCRRDAFRPTPDPRAVEVVRILRTNMAVAASASSVSCYDLAARLVAEKFGVKL